MGSNVAETEAPGGQAYTSTATRTGDHWTVQCDQRSDVYSTVRLLSQAVEDQRQVLADLIGVPEEKITVVVRPALPEAAERHLAQARLLRKTANWANSAAAAERRAAARALSEAGLSTRDIGTVLGVSHQRAHQLFQRPRRAPAR